MISRKIIIDGPLYDPGTNRRLAQASSLEPDSRWHTRLGYVLTIYDHFEDGCKEFMHALQLDPANFRARMWLAEARGKQGKLNLAIETSLAALKQCPEDEHDLQVDIWSNVRDWRYKLDDEGGTIEAIKASFAIIKGDQGSNLANFRILYNLRQYQLIIDMAKTLDETPSQYASGSLLDTFVRVFVPHVILGCAASVLGKLDYIDHIFRRAVSNASQIDDIVSEREQRAYYSWFVFAFMRDESEALEISKAVVSQYLTSPPAKRFSKWDDRDSRWFAESLLIQIYLRKAFAHHPDTSTTWITELQNSLKQLQTLKTQEVEASVYRNQGSSAMGLWHRIHGLPDVARRWLRELVLEGLQILTDTDPDNDVEGYLILGKALLTFGDRRNASIAFAVAGARPNSFEKIQRQDRVGTSISVNVAEATLTQRSTESLDATSAGEAVRINPASDDATETEDLAPCFFNRCAGQCGRKMKTWTAYYRCEYCYDTGFCDECAGLVQASKLPFLVCDSSHPFLQVYPIDMDMACAGACVENGAIVPRTEWLDSLRQEWAA